MYKILAIIIIKVTKLLTIKVWTVPHLQLFTQSKIQFKITILFGLSYIF